MAVDAAVLETLHGHLRRGVAMVVAAGRPGWLLRMATHERSYEDFVNVHNSILDILQVLAHISSRRLKLRLSMCILYSCLSPTPRDLSGWVAFPISGTRVWVNKFCTRPLILLSGAESLAHS